MKIILSVQKSCFLVDLRSFLRVLCMEWEQRSLYCNKEAAVTYTCCCLSNKLLQVSWWFSRQRYFEFISWHLVASKLYCSFVQQVEFWVIVLFLGDFTPECIVLNSHGALATSQDHDHPWNKTTARGKKLFTNYLWTTINYFLSIVRRGSFLRKLVTGSCFVLCVATSPRDKNTATLQTPSPLH